MIRCAGCAGIIKFIQHNPRHVIAVVPGDIVAAATLVATVTTAVLPGKLLFDLKAALYAV